MPSSLRVGARQTLLPTDPTDQYRLAGRFDDEAEAQKSADAHLRRIREIRDYAVRRFPE